MLTKTPSRLLKPATLRGRKRSAQAADLALGAAVRLRRHEVGLSQGALGKKIGVTFQQIQNYENGANRISGSRLIRIACVLDTSIAALTGEAVVADKTGLASSTLLLLARCAPARMLMVQVQQLHNSHRNAAIADLARAAGQMMAAT